ncbi:MAG: TonB family protein [Chryseolinea sp.]
MKLSSQFVILILSTAIMQSCSMKPKEPTAEEIAAKEKASADSIASVIESEKTAKRAKLDQENTEKSEKRRLAAEERSKKAQFYKDGKGKTIYIKAEEMPTYDGGNEAMMKYLTDNLQYPAAARDDGEEGTVFVDFVIDPKGKVQDVAASDAVNDNVNLALKNESVRVVSSMPNWKPAMHKGKPVSAAYSLPVKFQLD